MSKYRKTSWQLGAQVSRKNVLDGLGFPLAVFVFLVGLTVIAILFPGSGNGIADWQELRRNAPESRNEQHAIAKEKVRFLQEGEKQALPEKREDLSEMMGDLWGP